MSVAAKLEACEEQRTVLARPFLHLDPRTRGWNIEEVSDDWVASGAGWELSLGRWPEAQEERERNGKEDGREGENRERQAEAHGDKSSSDSGWK